MQRAKKIIAGLLCAIFVSAHVTVTSGLIGCPEAFKKGETYEGGWEQRSGGDRRLQDDNLVWEVPEWVDSGEGQTRLLYKDYERVTGKPYEPRSQGPVPSCVGHAVAAAVDFLAHVEIRAGEPERVPPAPAAACVIYGLSRIEIGELPVKAGGGSHNLWACQAIKKYGVVARLNYPLLRQDLRIPDPARAVLFGRNGIPRGLEMIARIHPVKDYIDTSTYEKCRDAIYMGCPVVVGASQGFGEGRLTRDEDGFLNPPRRLFFPSVWHHSQVVIGMCDEGRKGVLILNSWGKQWINGPKRFGTEPDGSYWVDADIFDKMAREGDCFCLRGFEGYPSYRLWRP